MRSVPGALYNLSSSRFENIQSTTHIKTPLYQPTYFELSFTFDITAGNQNCIHLNSRYLNRKMIKGIVWGTQSILKKRLLRKYFCLKLTLMLHLPHDFVRKKIRHLNINLKILKKSEI